MMLHEFFTVFRRFERASRNGFNLIEAAIVLGVVGLVIGGIWIAAATIQRELDRNDIKTAILHANQNFLRVWGRMPLVDDGSHYISFAPAIFSPGELVSSAGFSGVYSYYDFGGQQVYRSQRGLVMAMYADLTNSPNKFLYIVGPMDRGNCVWLARRFLEMFPDNGGVDQSGMGQIGITNSAGTALSFYNYGYDGYNLGTDMINAVSSACERTRTNYFEVSTGRPR